MLYSVALCCHFVFRACVRAGLLGVEEGTAFVIPCYVVQVFRFSVRTLSTSSPHRHRPSPAHAKWSVYTFTGSKEETGSTHVTVFRSTTACSVLARLSTFWNSLTRCRMRECMYALEHLMW